ncbi:MAG: SlyX family protein, partial [Pseudomonadota bacterium]
MTSSSPQTAESRLLALEEKLAFTEDLVDELNRVVARQQQQIEALARELVRHRRQVAELVERGGEPGA